MCPHLGYHRAFVVCCSRVVCIVVDRKMGVSVLTIKVEEVHACGEKEDLQFDHNRLVGKGPEKDAEDVWGYAELFTFGLGWEAGKFTDEPNDTGACFWVLDGAVEVAC